MVKSLLTGLFSNAIRVIRSFVEPLVVGRHLALQTLNVNANERVFAPKFTPSSAWLMFARMVFMPTLYHHLGSGEWPCQRRKVHVVPTKEATMGVHDTVRKHERWSRLAELVHDLAFLDGGHDAAFTLASGRESRWFFDTKPVMMHPEAAGIMGELLNLRIKAMGAFLVGGLSWAPCPSRPSW